MISLGDLTITDINEVVTVNSVRGEDFQVINRCHYGISFCTEGQITYTHNGVDYVSDQEHAIILPKGQSYSLHRDKTGMFALINFECTDFSTDTFCVFSIKNSEELMKDFEKLKMLFMVKRNRAGAMSIFYDIIYKLSNATIDIPNILLPAIKHLEKACFSSNLSNRELAEKCNISEVYFRRLFFNKFGTTPRKFIIDLRISMAKQLLADGILKINAVSVKCGFTNPYHFCRIFKEKTGVTPTKYMKDNITYKL